MIRLSYLFIIMLLLAPNIVAQDLSRSQSEIEQKVSSILSTMIGQEARARGVHFMLGPGVNIYRAPMAGRNFEYYGEDPFLASCTAVAYIKGIQSQGVIATVKHFLGNNQEYDRHNVSSDID